MKLKNYNVIKYQDIKCSRNETDLKHQLRTGHQEIENNDEIRYPGKVSNS